MKDRKYLYMLITFIVFFTEMYSQEIEIKKTDLYGCWICVNDLKEHKEVHDTITFFPNKFLTTIERNTINEGKWKIKGKTIILKSCIHSADNPYKCRNRTWNLEIINIKTDTISIKLIKDTKLVYALETQKEIFPELDYFVKDTLKASWHEYLYTVNLKITPEYGFQYEYSIHSAGPPKIAVIKGKVRLLSAGRILLKTNNKKFKEMKIGDDKIIDLDARNNEGKELIISK